jgi:hypothetical protein
MCKQPLSSTVAHEQAYQQAQQQAHRQPQEQAAACLDFRDDWDRVPAKAGSEGQTCRVIMDKAQCKWTAGRRGTGCKA